MNLDFVVDVLQPASNLAFGRHSVLVFNFDAIRLRWPDTPPATFIFVPPAQLLSALLTFELDVPCPAKNTEHGVDELESSLSYPARGVMLAANSSCHVLLPIDVNNRERVTWGMYMRLPYLVLDDRFELSAS